MNHFEHAVRRTIPDVTVAGYKLSVASHKRDLFIIREEPEAGWAGLQRLLRSSPRWSARPPRLLWLRTQWLQCSRRSETCSVNFLHSLPRPEEIHGPSLTRMEAGESGVCLCSTVLAIWWGLNVSGLENRTLWWVWGVGFKVYLLIFVLWSGP